MTVVSADNRRTDEEASPSLLDVVQGLVTYFGFPAVLLYPAGFLVLTLQISMFYPLDFWTGWYATSLIPVPVVTGQGVKVLLVPLFISWLTSWVVGRILDASFGEQLELENAFRSDKRGFLHYWEILRKQRSILRKHLKSLLARPMIIVPVIVFLVFIVPVSAAILATLLASVREVSRFTDWVFLVPLALSFGLFGGWLVAHDYREWLVAYDDRAKPTETGEHPATPSHWGLLRGVTEGWVLRGLLVAYVGTVVSSLLFLIILSRYLEDQHPDLPRVELTFSDKVLEDGDKTVEDALLLAHSNGFWHVIDMSSKVNTKARIGGQSLLMAPDGEVEDVTIYESPLYKADLDLKFVRPDESIAWVSKLKYGAWANEEVQYKAKVANAGPDTATDVKLTIDLPPSVSTTVKAQLAANCVTKNGTTVCDLGKLNMGEDREIAFVVEPEVEVLRSAPTLNVESAEEDPDPRDEIELNVALWVKATTSGHGAYKPGTWTKRDVTVNLAANGIGSSDGEKIIYSASGSQKLEKKAVSDPARFDIDKEGTTRITYQVQGDAGSREEESFRVKLDKTDPRHSCDPRDEQWQADNVRINCTASDNDGSGLAGASPANFSLSTSVDAGDETDNASTGSQDLYDLAGNKAAAGPYAGIKVDRKAPVTTADAGDYTEGEWTNQNVTVTLEADDGGSGVKGIAYSIDEGKFKPYEPNSGVSVTTDGEHMVNYKATDNVNNVEDVETFTVRLDKTAPKVTPGDDLSDGTTWYNSVQERSFEASDSGSGLVKGDGLDIVDGVGTFELNVAGEPTDKDASGNYVAVEDSYTVKDKAGNETKRRFSALIDLTKPELAAKDDIPAVEATGPDGAKVIYTNPDAGDALSGLVDSGVDCKPASGSLFPLGETTVECSTTDEAGNKASKFFKANVIYGFDRFLPPIEGNLYTLHAVRAGEAVLVQFSLGGDRGADVFAEKPSLKDIGCGSRSVVSIEHSDLRYTSGVDHYTYAYGTQEDWVGMCQQLVLKLRDGTQHRVNFKFVE